MENPVEQELSATEVGAWYDRFGDLYSLTMGDSMHLGMWDGGVRPDPGRALSSDEAWQELTQAQDRWTDELISELALVGEGRRVLDIGCGTGRPTVRLARTTGVQATGITASRTQTAQAAERAARAGLADHIDFTTGDAMHLPFPDASFDGAWAIESFAHFADRLLALREAWRVLRPGGRLVLADCYEASSFTDEEVRLFRTGFALPRLALSPGAYADLAREAGFTVDRVRDKTGEFGPTYDLISLVYAGRRPRIADLLGPEAASQLDLAYPLVLELCRTKMGYTAVTATKPGF
ncbi:27-O-demethylrifamycin SV methyltransferase [Streptomyces sannanensis]|uniref:27-O-demethylrifamycin SV methyltransferase n=1 Tax=Streptomyces sannanensis TaxID=285536 RepID=A0ABP6S3J9_9ACTN